MIDQSQWFERKFEFNFPPGVFPCILERLRGTPARLDEMVRSYPPDILTVRVGGGWSIQEHAGHLFDLDELHDARIDDFLAGAKVLRPADLQNRKTFEANHNAQSIDSILRSFRAARHQFVQRLEGLDDKIIARSAIHPRLQTPMRVIDMAFFVAEHDDHHAARMAHLAGILVSRIPGEG